MEEFAPDPEDVRLNDDELERIRQESNPGGVKGIELRGNGVGAGSGEEVAS
jgi:EKC/KEOPS complex subunit PCC1/LAGE3